MINKFASGDHVACACCKVADDVAEERDDLRAENERLKDVDARRFALFQARNEEIERLRAAIQRMIEHLENCSDTWTPTDLLLADIREALK